MDVNGGYFLVTFNPIVGWFHLVVGYLGPNNGHGLIAYVNGTEVGRDASRYDEVHPAGNGQLIIDSWYVDSDYGPSSG